MSQSASRHTLNSDHPGQTKYAQAAQNLKEKKPNPARVNRKWLDPNAQKRIEQQINMSKGLSETGVGQFDVMSQTTNAMGRMTMNNEM